MDALLAVPEHEDGRVRPVIIGATDAPFAEAPVVLYPDIQVTATTEEAIATLEEIEAHIHLFIGPHRAHLEEGFRNADALGGLATLHPIDSVRDSSERIRNALLAIGREVACRR